MSKDPTSLKEIDDYLSGELSPEHIAEFEKRLREDEEVKEDVSAFKKVIEGIEGYAFKEKMKAIHKQLFGE